MKELDSIRTLVTHAPPSGGKLKQGSKGGGGDRDTKKSKQVEWHECSYCNSKHPGAAEGKCYKQAEDLLAEREKRSNSNKEQRHSASALKVLGLDRENERNEEDELYLVSFPPLPACVFALRTVHDRHGQRVRINISRHPSCQTCTFIDFGKPGQCRLRRQTRPVTHWQKAQA
eukprot:2692044-Rhodomonas_salina.1